MSCMARLPDDTYLMTREAKTAQADLCLGEDPNDSAVLYDPRKATNSRMSVIANTTVACLYHSEAILLLDGLVSRLVSGLCPSGRYYRLPRRTPCQSLYSALSLVWACQPDFYFDECTFWNMTRKSASSDF